jgi:hypothetical protein
MDFPVRVTCYLSEFSSSYLKNSMKMWTIPSAPAMPVALLYRVG